MISSADFTSFTRSLLERSPPGSKALFGRERHLLWGFLLATDGEFSCPSVGNFLSAYGEYFMAADTLLLLTPFSPLPIFRRRLLCCLCGTFSPCSLQSLSTRFLFTSQPSLRSRAHTRR